MATHSGDMSLGNLPAVQNGDVFENCNMTQAIPTEIAPGKSGLIVRGECNLQNTIWPDDTVFECDARPYVKSWCKHLVLEEEDKSRKWVLLPDEPDMCPHVDSVEEIVTDGQTFTKYMRSHKVVI